jgi:hypothetical protein
MRGDVAQEAHDPRLIDALTAPASKRHGAVGAGAGVLDLVRDQIRLTELHDAERVVNADPCTFVAVTACCREPAPSSMRPDNTYTCPREAMAIGM